MPGNSSQFLKVAFALLSNPDTSPIPSRFLRLLALTREERSVPCQCNG